MKQKVPAIYTIGHSNHTWERFAQLLTPHEIDLLVDVRSYPRSRFAPWSNRDRFEANLSRIGVDYLWRGDSLGGMQRGPKTPKYPKLPTVDEWYEQRTKEPDFLAAVLEVSRLATGKRLTVMCSEGDASRVIVHCFLPHNSSAKGWKSCTSTRKASELPPNC